MSDSLVCEVDMPAPIFTCLRKPVKTILGCMITALLAMSGLIEPHAVATSIVILSNSKTIWVAADSKATPGAGGVQNIQNRFHVLGDVGSD